MTESKEAEQSGFRSRLAALLVADMVGYSSLLESNDQQAMEAIRELKDVLLEPAVRAYSGEVLKRMGDGWVFAFSSVADLCSCALEVQTKLIDHPVTKLRFGGHIGEIVEDKDDFSVARYSWKINPLKNKRPASITEYEIRQESGVASSVYKISFNPVNPIPLSGMIKVNLPGHI